MANVAFTISPAPGVTNDLIAVLYEISPSGGIGAEIARLEKDAPHPSPHDFNFANVVPKTYIVKIHESTAPGSGLLGILRHDFWVDASLQKLLSYEVRTFQVGAGRGTPYFDPADQAVDYINTDLDGKTYTVFKPGYGPLDWTENITTYTGGGFSFIDGQKFAQDEIYTILVSNLLTQPLPQAGGGYPDNVVEIVGDIAFTSTHYNKLIEVNSANQVVVISIADLTTVPDGTIFGINTQNGTQRYVTLQLPVGKYCLINRAQRTSVYVGRGEEVTFIKKGNYLRIVNWDGDYRRVGEIIYSGGWSGPNVIELAGGWVNKTSYPRLFNWYVNLLPVGELGTGTDDVTPNADNKTKWIIGVNKFWIPDHRGFFHRVISADNSIDLEGPRLSGDNQGDDNKAHNHVTSPWNKATARASDVDSTNTPSGLDNNNPGTEPRVGNISNTQWTAATIQSQGSESRPKNVATNAYVII